MSIKRFTLAFLLLSMFSELALAQLGSRSFSGFSNQPEPLPLEQAFPFYVSVLGPGRYRVSWNLAEGHYLYRHAFDFTMQQSSEAEELPIDYSLPDGLKKTDQFFGEIEAYYNNVSVDINLPTVPGPDASLVIQYQGCADWGFCYPPQRTEFILLP